MVQNGLEVIRMRSSLLKLCFYCNSINMDANSGGCSSCKYNDSDCDMFISCFKLTPCVFWSRITCFEQITNAVEEWRCYHGTANENN